jgi:DMSO/TMAO reductase YedYZ molybdopterin-dependent catalytic subunit
VGSNGGHDLHLHWFAAGHLMDWANPTSSQWRTPYIMQRPSRLLAAAVGLAAGAASLAAAELVAALGTTTRSPILDVGDRVIDLVPPWLKEAAIQLFGTNDKLALLAGIGAILVVYSAAVGIIAMRHRLLPGIIGILAFGAVGATAGLLAGRGLVSVLPAGIGALVGVVVLLALHRAWFRRRDSDTGVGSEDRRRFLVGLGATFVTAGIAAGAGRLTAASAAISPASAANTLTRVARPLPQVGAGADLGLPGLTPFITPNDEFYRIDTALSVPRVSVEDFSLRIFGMVDRELILSYADLTARAQIESDITLTCVSNEVGGQLVGNARWQGIRLDALLAEAGVQPGADQVVGRSVDNYTCGFPVAAATDGRDSMIAIGMNGEPLPLVHGFPARLVVPGLYGYVSATKWLKEIEITTFEAFDHYWARREWSAQAPIKTQSRIDTPGPLDSVPAGPGTIAGVAWAQTRGIAKVEVQIDDGPWQTAELAEEVANTTWRQWRLHWEVTPGRHTITCRATDATGDVQAEERATPMPDGATGWHSIVVLGD